MKPLVSICTAGRNDNYTPDFLYRMETTLNFAADALNEIQSLDKIEFVITDWGSDTPLSETLQLSPHAASMTRFICVPQKTVAELNNGKQSFNIINSLNCAMRRAHGTFIALCGADLIIPASSFKALLDVLEKRILAPFNPVSTYFNCGRFDLPWEFIERQPPLKEWKRYLTLNSWHIAYREDTTAPGFMRGGTGFLLFHKDIVTKTRGLDQKLEGWGWSDIDITLRCMAEYSWTDLRSYGFLIYDMAHSPTEGDRVTAIQNPPPLDININIEANDADWGLSRYDFEELLATPKTTSTISSKEPETWTIDLQKEDLLNRFLSFLMDLQDSGRWNKPLTTQECLTLLTISWLATEGHITNALEFGVKNVYALATANHFKKDLEMYLIDEWQGIEKQTAPHNIGHILHMPPVNGRAYARFVNGHKETAFERLKKTFIGQCELDLIILRESFLKDLTIKTLFDVLPYLKKDKGVVLLIASSNDTIERALAKLTGNYTVITNENHQSCLICNDPLKHVSGKLILADEVVPRQIEQRLFEFRRQKTLTQVLLKWEIISQNRGRIIFFGAGKYCKWLIKNLKLQHRRLPDIIVDDHNEESIYEMPCSKPQNIASTSLDLFVLATDTHQHLFGERVKELFPKNQFICLHE